MERRSLSNDDIRGEDFEKEDYTDDERIIKRLFAISSVDDNKYDGLGSGLFESGKP